MFYVYAKCSYPDNKIYFYSVQFSRSGIVEMPDKTQLGPELAQLICTESSSHSLQPDMLSIFFHLQYADVEMIYSCILIIMPDFSYMCHTDDITISIPSHKEVEKKNHGVRTVPDSFSKVLVHQFKG